MKEFIVTVKEVYSQGYRVTASTKEDAIKAIQSGGGELVEGLFEYGHTLDPEVWGVEECA